MSSYDALRKSVPGFVRSEPVLDLIYRRTGLVLDKLCADISLLKGMVESITTCPDEGLLFWECLFDMENPGLSPQSRRELLRMRCRGTGTLTEEFIASLVESFENGEVVVTDHPRDSMVEIRFTSTIGTPTNIEAVREALDDYLHAHYDAIFTFRYLMVREVAAMTVAQMESMLLDSFAFTKGG